MTDSGGPYMAKVALCSPFWRGVSKSLGQSTRIITGDMRSRILKDFKAKYGRRCRIGFSFSPEESSVEIEKQSGTSVLSVNNIPDDLGKQQMMTIRKHLREMLLECSERVIKDRCRRGESK